MRVLILASALGLAACTDINPAYDGSGPGDGATQDTASSTTGTQTSADSSGAPACELGSSRPLTISVTLGNSRVDPDCSDPATYDEYTLGANLYPDTYDRVVHEQCNPPVCDCAEEPPQLLIALTADGETAFADGVELPDCGRVSMWARMGPAGCEWAGVVLWDDVELLVPRYIASRTLDVPPFAVTGAPFMLGLETDDPCEDFEVCSDLGHGPGRHALDVLGYRTVTMDEAPPFIDLPFGAPGTMKSYLFDNRMARITADCEQQVSWTAQLWQ